MPLRLSGHKPDDCVASDSPCTGATVGLQWFLIIAFVARGALPFYSDKFGAGGNDRLGLLYIVSLTQP
jgi:hypothetical protein